MGDIDAEMLRTLNSAIAQLEHLRATLQGAAPAGRTAWEGPSRHTADPSWPWFAAGSAVGSVFVLLVLLAWLAS